MLQLELGAWYTLDKYPPLSRVTCAEMLLLAIACLYIHSVGSTQVISIEISHRSSWL